MLSIIQRKNYCKQIFLKHTAFSALEQNLVAWTIQAISSDVSYTGLLSLVQQSIHESDYLCEAEAFIYHNSPSSILVK